MKKRTSLCDLTVLDLFGQPVYLTLNHGKKKKESVVGAIVTILMLLLIVLYGCYKGMLMVESTGNLTTAFVEDSHFGEDYVFSSYKNSFEIAYGFASKNGVETPEEDKTYGHLSLEYLDW